MKIECPCGKYHDMTPTALMVVIQAFQEGDLQKIEGRKGIMALCMLQALTEERVTAMQFRYPGRRISVETYVTFVEEEPEKHDSSDQTTVA